MSHTKTYIVQSTSQSYAAYTQYTDTIQHVICDIIIAMYMLHSTLLHHNLHNIVIVLPLQAKEHKYTNTINITHTVHCTPHAAHHMLHTAAHYTHCTCYMLCAYYICKLYALH